MRTKAKEPIWIARAKALRAEGYGIDDVSTILRSEGHADAERTRVWRWVWPGGIARRQHMQSEEYKARAREIARAHHLKRKLLK